jgi:tetratricopeptide (TPR) repeat protein
VDQAHEALRLADADPGRATTLATEARRRARARHDHASVSVSERALGMAAVHVAEPRSAVRHLRAAAAAGRRAGSFELAVDARIQIAWVLGIQGRARLALREIGDVLDLDLDPLRRARATAQSGVLLSQLGRHDEAIAAYQRAIPVLRRHADLPWLWRALSNRGLSRAYRNEFGPAETDLEEAGRLCRELGLDLSVAFCRQNTGWVAGMRGDVPAALDHLHRAEQSFRRLGSDLGEILTDRSQLLLSAFLVTEAREAAEQAVELLERTGRHLTLPEVRLLLAQTAAASGRHGQALEQAGLAIREFDRQQRPGWALLGRFVEAKVRGVIEEPPPGGVPELADLADALEASRWLVPALETRVMAGRLSLSLGDPDGAARHLAAAAGWRTRGHVMLRARAWYAEALLRHTRGNRRGARIAVRCGLRVLDEHRATFGATDLRAYASGHRVELAALGLAMAIEDGGPARVLRWAEEGRASHLLLRPVRPPDDRELAQTLGELRATAQAVYDAVGAGRPTARLVTRRLELERAVRDRTRRLRADDTDPLHAAVPAAEIAAALGGSALVEYVVDGPALLAVTVAGGRILVHRLGDLARVADLIDRIPFALRRMAHPGTRPQSRQAAADLLRQAAAELDALVLGPLARAVGDRPLVLVPTGPLQSVPWSVLPSCAGRPVNVAPSAALWCAADRAPLDGHGITVAAGPGLPGADAEAQAVAGLHGVDPILGGAATAAALSRGLDGVRMAHIAAHGDVHPTNPLFSAIQLHDGPLTVYDLEHLVRAPELVVLSACHVGRAAVTAGDELLGLTATFLAHGTRQVVASVMPVPDIGTTTFMVAFHDLLRTGKPAGAALAEAQANVDRDDHTAVAAAAGFVSLGSEWSLAAPVAVPLPRSTAAVPAAVRSRV